MTENKRAWANPTPDEAEKVETTSEVETKQSENVAPKAEETEQSKTAVSVSDVLQMLKDGKTRSQIALHYHMNRAQMMRLFAHPKLKGKKTHTGKPRVSNGKSGKGSRINDPFVVVDDTEATA